MTTPFTVAQQPAASDARRLLNSRLVPWLGIPLLAALFFHKLAFTNLILARGDTFLYFYPYWQVAADALRAGRLPLWNPAIFMGVPFLANSQVGFFYPLNWLVWLLRPVPYAVSLSILIHVVIAGWGAAEAGRRLLGLRPWPALLAGSLFALGGYLTAQVEHVNQLQGLAWLPWCFVALAPLLADGAMPDRPTTLRAGLSLAALFALQLLAGHSQTTFITGSAVALAALVGFVRFRSDRRRALALVGVVAGSVTLAVLIAAVQLAPTLELTGLSSRQGGLQPREVLSFSWHPLHVTRGLLPAYGQSLFTEYVMTLPLVALALASIGVVLGRRSTAFVALLLVGVVGLILAFGRFTPIYWLLAYLPGFNLFRVPARWLVLLALVLALLAGLGWQRLMEAPAWSAAERRRAVWALLLAAGLAGLLMLWGYAAGGLADLIQTGNEAPYEAPSARTVVGWGLEAAAMAGLLWLGLRRGQGWALAALPLVGLTALWFTSRSLPYNNPTTPEAYFDLRPPIARLQALAACAAPSAACLVPPGRVLSLSDIFFDPGDQAEIDSIYADQLNASARYDYTVAIKHKEVLSPNLPMAYGLSSVDGFDGGVLPLRDYAAVAGLALPRGQATTDGRLREFLDAVPEPRLLDLFNARYLITDKTGDVWRDGVLFDRQFPITIEPGQSANVGKVDFAATELRLLSEQPPLVEVETSDGASELTPGLRAGPDEYAVPWPAADGGASLQLRCPAAGEVCRVDALTLVDTRDGAFWPIIPAPFRLIQSGDVKVYEKTDVLPRAHLVSEWNWVKDVDEAVVAMADEGFDPRLWAVVIGQGEPVQGVTSGSATVQIDEPERVTIGTSAVGPSLLVLADADYPGWQVQVDGAPAEIVRANGLFRGVVLPPGEHTVEFAFRPASVRIGLILSAAGMVIWAGAWWVAGRAAGPKRRNRVS